MQADKSLTLSLLDYQNGQVKLSGQHEELIVVRTNGEVELVDTDDLGFPIGLDDDIADFIDETTIDLQPGDGIVLYTDGITESRNSDGVMFEPERLADTLNRTHSRTPADSLKAVVTRVDKWNGKNGYEDDCSLVLVELLGLRNDTGSIFDLNFEEEFDVDDATMMM